MALNEKLRVICKEICQNLKFTKRNHVRRAKIPRNSKTLQNAVKKANDQNITPNPDNITYNNVPIEPLETADSFAGFFVKKVMNIVDECTVKNNIYNGTQKVNMVNKNFMTLEHVLSAVKSLKSKHCEGFNSKNLN